MVRGTCNVFLLTGSYDHTIKLWDKRSKECVGTFEHGHPVESVVALSTGTIIVTAGIVAPVGTR